MNNRKKIKILTKAYRFYYRCRIRYLTKAAYRSSRIDRKWFELFSFAAEDRPSEHTYKVLKGFLAGRIQLRKRAAGEIVKNAGHMEPVILCVEKNSLIYLQRFLPYYRDLGIKHFIFIDNASEDGSAEYLGRQDDVTLYSAPFPFESHRKVGWLLQAVEENGVNQWYLRVDSDEFLTWEGMEESGITGMLAKVRKRGMHSIRSVMVDMYPSWKLMENTHDDNRFLKDFIYFDGGESYYVDAQSGGIYGGMRSRTTGAHLRMDKYILFNPAYKSIPVSNHDITGLHDEAESVCRCALRHYKFLPSEKSKYEYLVKEKKSGYSAFAEVKKYGTILEGNVRAVSVCSKIYEYPESLRCIDFIKPL